MNILFYHSNGIIPTAGGISRVTANLAHIFSSKGNNVWLLGARNLHSSADYAANQVFLPKSELLAADNIEFTRNLLKKNKIDVIVNQSALNSRSSLFLAECKKGLDILLIACFHNSILTPIYNGAYQKEFVLKKRHLLIVFNLIRCSLVRSLMTAFYIAKYRKDYCRVLELSDAVFVLCDGQKEELLKMCGIPQCDKLYVVPNANPADSTIEGEKKNIVLWIGTFDYSIKRPDYMIRVWRKIEENNPNWTLYMLGCGPSWQEMKNLASSLHLKNIVFTGNVSPANYYREAKLSCVTSVHESFSMVLLESLSSGVVPISFNSFTSSSFLIRDKENGRLVKAFDLDSFASELMDLMENSKLVEKMSMSAKKSAKRFSANNVYNLWVSIITSIK